MEFEDVAAAKQAMRQRILEGRGGLTDDELRTHAAGIAEQALGLPQTDAAETVAAYYSIGSEPGTRAIVRTLLDSGRRVLLPIVLGDFDLDWAELTDPTDLETAGRLGLQEPTGSRLGCYDRALARVDADTARCIVVYDHEVVESVPTTRRDQKVNLAVTPTRTLPLGHRPSGLSMLRTDRRA